MRTNSGVPRRAVLFGIAVGAVAGCTAPEPPPPPDPLSALADRASTDAAMASAIAASVPSLASAAEAVARVRSEHAAALTTEVERVRPPVSSSAAPPPGAPRTPSGEKAARAELVGGLTDAQEQAAALIGTAPRYRAGLVGSVAAACASLREVL